VIAEAQSLVVLTGQSDHAIVFHSLLRGSSLLSEGSGDVEKRNHSLSLHFYVSHTMEFFDKVRKVLRFLAECLTPWSAEDGMIPYSVTKRLITMTVIRAKESNNNKDLVYDKRCEKRG